MSLFIDVCSIIHMLVLFEETLMIKYNLAK